jgi:hypothetical protein
VNSLTPSKKTKKELNEQLKENKLPVQPVNSVREKRELQAHLQHAVKAWQHFLLEAENNQQLTLDYTSCFSDTHLHVSLSVSISSHVALMLCFIVDPQGYLCKGYSSGMLDDDDDLIRTALLMT